LKIDQKQEIITENGNNSYKKILKKCILLELNWEGANGVFSNGKQSN
jgi:hypothetical protein